MWLVDAVVSCFSPAPWHDALIFFFKLGAVDLRNGIPLEWRYTFIEYR